MADKALLWLGSSREDIRAFPEDARRLAGFQLRSVQQGLDPSDWKPMPVRWTGSAGDTHSHGLWTPGSLYRQIRGSCLRAACLWEAKP